MKKLSPIFLSGHLVDLRLIDKDLHLESCLTWLNNQVVTKFLALRGWPVYPKPEEAWFDGLDKIDNAIKLAIHVKEDNRYIGNISLERIDYISGTAYTGAFIGEVDCWNKGFGTDAKMALLRHAFMVLNLRKICSVVAGFNPRSAAYSKKCGYRVEGRLRKQIYYDGKYWDDILLAVYKNQFMKAYNNYQAKFANN